MPEVMGWIMRIRKARLIAAARRYYDGWNRSTVIERPVNADDSEYYVTVERDTRVGRR